MVFARYAGEDGERTLALAQPWARPRRRLGAGWRRSAPGRPGTSFGLHRSRAGAGTEVRPPAGPSRRCTPRRAGQGRCWRPAHPAGQCRAEVAGRILQGGRPWSVRGSGSPLRTRRAAWAAASPPDTRLCMRWTLASSAALYRQSPGVPCWLEEPYRCSPPGAARTDARPFGQFTDPKVARSGIGHVDVVALLFVRPYCTSNRLFLYRLLTTGRAAGNLSTGPRQTLDEGGP